jgi:hypothetical protein
MASKKHPQVLSGYAQRRREALESISPERVTRRGSAAEVLMRHWKEAELVLRAGRPGLEKVAPHLLRRLSDARILDLAWHELRAMEVRAPGPDGVEYLEPDDEEKWGTWLALHKQIRGGEYRPGPERVTQITLGFTQASRPFSFQNVVDRVVGHAASLILAPLLYPRFADPVSGHRPGADPLYSLALAEHYFHKQGRQVWVMAAVADPEAHVRLPEVVRLVRAYLLADDVARLVGRIVGGSSLPGLRPSGVLSLLLLDLYPYALVERPWRERHPGLPLLRVLGEFLAPCRSPREARQASATLSDLLAEAGMPVSGDKPLTVRPVGPDCAATWLGFRVCCVDGEMRYHVADAAFEQLAVHLSLAREDLSPGPRADRFIEEWVAELGPAFAWETDTACDVYRRVEALAAGLGFNRIMGRRRFRDLWRRAVRPWIGFRGICQFLAAYKPIFEAAGE